MVSRRLRFWRMPSSGARTNPVLGPGALFNAGLVFFTFAVSLPALILPSNRTWLKLHGWLVTACGVVTLAIGLDVWFSTLRTRSNLAVLWGQQKSNDLSLLQQKVPATFFPFPYTIGF